MKIITAKKAAELIQNNMTVGVDGFGGWSCADTILKAIGRRYHEEKEPSALTAVCGISPGALKNEDWGLSHLKEEGLLKGSIAAHVGMPPAIGQAVGADEVEGFMMPLGVISSLYRAMAAKKPGVITTVGLHTFADPRQEGCKVNQKAKVSNREMVRIMEINGDEYLFYPTFKMDACILRGTYADENGCISLSEEALTACQLEMAEAVHNNGGLVFIQVNQIVKSGTLSARDVHIHGNLVDYVVLADKEDQVQGYDFPDAFRSELLGDVKVPLSSVLPMKLDVRKVIGRRGAMELRQGDVINLGIGMPDGVANVANEEGILDGLTLAIESGLIGGVPVGGAGLGASVNPESIMYLADNFDLYDGGFLDMTFLGAAEIDACGNVNVSRFGSRVVGPGGFIDISQNTENVYFMGTFTAGKSEIKVEDGKLHIIKDGDKIKFKKTINQITFSAKYARQVKQNVHFITERAVFSLGENGLCLDEIAPGVDLQRDILDKMEFTPEISLNLKEMDVRIFKDAVMNLKG